MAPLRHSDYWRERAKAARAACETMQTGAAREAMLVVVAAYEAFAKDADFFAWLEKGGWVRAGESSPPTARCASLEDSKVVDGPPARAMT
jgi:hypothetical protein